MISHKMISRKMILCKMMLCKRIQRKRMLKTFKKMTTMKRNKINVAVCAAVVLLGFGACQTPQATVVKSDLKERLLKGDSAHHATQDTLLWWKRFDDTTLQTAH